jgi:glutathione synthase/RimK-type ligase-like ATP-grasp enzyme
MTILFVRGINDNNKVTPHVTPSGQIAFEFDGSCSVYRYLEFDKHEASTIVLFPSSANQRAVRIDVTPSLIFNEISDADSHKETLTRCAKLCASFAVPVINDPRRVLETSREKVALSLSGIEDLRIPKTKRITPSSPYEVIERISEEGFDYPVIVRLAGAHGGTSNVILTTESDIDQLHRYPFDGSSIYLTQFVDYRDSDGFYTKYRIVVVDGEPLLRHVLMDSNWMIHASTQKYMDRNPELWERERAISSNYEFEVKPRLLSTVKEVSRRLGLDYYGIDCAFNGSGEMLVFEANANMNVLFNRNPKYDDRVALIKKRIYELLESRMTRQADQQGPKWETSRTNH